MTRRRSARAVSAPAPGFRSPRETNFVVAQSGSGGPIVVPPDRAVGRRAADAERTPPSRVSRERTSRHAPRRARVISPATVPIFFEGLRALSAT